ncbi:EutN/CcmL family microcompartment protein [Phormidium pseudopriestleyi FRX01]|uniref:Carboxysome shell vertex protein CcmL n=1 Tax=Phormidium pseudopriestleyi FRX01 TaxID=1759528 RepID=A0ABS3FRC2_9CYAN|nr:EutN/CcmL family microcompartment protein [Phormidium pseudopriestleyi]MBO0349664.1 EutN/CcmL family microcompartment protein [Phormidium pseudopriestleyi FRX01]
MQLAQVRGTVVSTQKDPNLQGVKLLLLQLIDEEGQLIPKYEVAADNVGAGIGEWVLVTLGSAARQVIRNDERPVDAAVIAIVDTVNVENRILYSKKETDRFR